jgi:phosphoenolpyruvate---glycerone phosphotransferase subunit DhaL
MTGADLVRTTDRALEHLAGCADELRDLDAALGDGDLGVTVGAGCRAVREALAGLPADVLPAQVLKTAAGAFARANPSTMAALVGGALLAAARGLGDAAELDRAGALAVGRAAAESIATRGKAQVGDKTVLDALVPSLDAMEAATDSPLEAGVAAARQGVEETRSLQSMRGRASWLGERSKGLQDPGATAYVRFLEGLQQAQTEEVA